MILIHRLRILYHSSYEMLHEVSTKVTRHYFAGAAVIQNSKVKIIQISISWSARLRGTKQGNRLMSSLVRFYSIHSLLILKVKCFLIRTTEKDSLTTGPSDSYRRQ